jgi:hypothetical protein
MIRELMARTGLIAQLGKLWKPDVEELTRPVRKDVRALQRDIERLESALDRLAAQVKLTAVLNRTQHDAVARLSDRLDAARIGAHVRDAIAAAPLLDEPFEHLVVESLLPTDVYDLLIEAIPPEPFFDAHDPIKRNLRFPMDFGPALSASVWAFFDDVVTRQMIRPAVVARFREPLQRHYDAIFGRPFRERAENMAQAVSGGRLMLRRAGYHLDPHRDPKHSMLTCLLYLARPGDSDAHGTQLFSVENDSDASYKQTFYPGQEGRRCELVKLVPFRANSMLVFLNSRGAHGATIPGDAPVSLERYSYQFYVAPEKAQLTELIRQLPEPLRRMWQSKGVRDGGGME